MRTIESLRQSTRRDVVTDIELSVLLGNGARRHSQVKRMLNRGELQRVKRGLYVFGEPYSRSTASPFYLSNVVFGPSYVSLESALSYYQLIPEAVPNVTAVTSERTYSLQTPLSKFLYRKIPREAFWRDVCIETIGSESCLIGSPEKSLLDKLYLDGAVEDLFSFVTSSLRVMEEDLERLSLGKLEELSLSYANAAFSKRVAQFLQKVQYG